MVNIDLCRQEKRFFLPGNKANKLFEVFGEQNFKQREFAEEVVQTIYFLDDQYARSLGFSYKARRYMTEFSTSIDLRELGEVKMFWEVKWGIGAHDLRQKSKRVELPLREIGTSVLKHSGCPMRPYMVVEYRRKHFQKQDSEKQFRVTVDTGTRFWFFPPGETLAIEVGDAAAADILRVELKFEASLVNSDEVQVLLHALETEGALPLISKKGDGLNFVKWWHDRQYGSASLVKELVEREVEAKISVTGFDFDQLFAALRGLYAPDNTNTRSIILDSSFPFVVATTTVNHYWLKAGTSVEGFKVLTRSGIAKSMCKGDHRVLDARLGILERTEKKGVNIPCTRENLSALVSARETEVGPLVYIGHFLRVRQAFWVISPENRLYHISLERCVAEKRTPLEQIEIEYTGLRTNKQRVSLYSTSKDCIIRDIRSLTENIITFVGAIGKGKGRITAMGVEKCAWLAGNT